MVTSTKKSTRLSDSRNPILSCKTKWSLWCSECSSGGYEFTSVNFYFLPPSGNFNPLVGKASNSVTSKNLKNKWPWEVTPHNVLDTDTLIILLYFMTVFMHMIINVTTSDLCFLVFSATTTLPGYYYYNDDGSNYYVYHWEWWTLNFDLVRLEL